MIIRYAIGVFLLLELLNVLALYFNPGTRKGNAMGAFTAFGTEDTAAQRLHTYMATWVAGSKLIFIGLLLVIILFASDTVVLYSLAVLILTILSYFWKLSPQIKDMDARGEIAPAGYSRTLDMMILMIVLVLAVAAIVEIL
ncbi:MAG: hypothetical protein ACXAE3_14895 [Candidatus Kariarchaeaceae archaeon]